MSIRSNETPPTGLSTRLSLAARGLACVVFLMVIPSCAKELQPEGTADDPGPAMKEVSALPVNSSGSAASLRPSSKSSLAPGTRLATLAKQLDQVAIEQSSALHELRAAEAGLAARRFERYPQIRPTASAPLTGGGSAAVGVSVEQTIWDGGRVRARLSALELRIAEAHMEAWRARNEAVYEGLRAFLEMSRLQGRIDVNGDLQNDLKTLAYLLETRASGGVADRGELLRIIEKLFFLNK